MIMQEINKLSQKVLLTIFGNLPKIWPKLKIKYKLIIRVPNDSSWRKNFKYIVLLFDKKQYKVQFLRKYDWNCWRNLKIND